MRRLPVGWVAAAALALFAPCGEAAAGGKMVRVEVHRTETNGLMDAIPCIITISGDSKGALCHDVIRADANKRLSGGKATVLLGGDHVICEINPSNSIQAFTPRALRPDGATPESHSWAPTTFAPLVPAGRTVGLEVVPKSRGSTYVGGWLVRQSPPEK